jgi:hypothetical protein
MPKKAEGPAIDLRLEKGQERIFKKFSDQELLLEGQRVVELTKALTEIEEFKKVHMAEIKEQTFRLEEELRQAIDTISNRGRNIDIEAKYVIDYKAGTMTTYNASTGEILAENQTIPDKFKQLSM